MSNKALNDVNISDLRDDDIAKIRSTIKRIPGKDTGDENADRKNGRVFIVLGIIIASVTLVVAGIILFVVLMGNSNKDAIAGKWSFDQTTVYYFDGKGKGSLQLPLITYDFSYELTDKNVSIDFEDESVEDKTFLYSVSDDLLTLAGDDGISYTLTKELSGSSKS